MRYQSIKFRWLGVVAGTIGTAFVSFALGYARARRIREALTKAQSPLRFDKARVYLTRHKLIKHFVFARTHLRGELSQIRGFLARAKTKLTDELSRSRRDFFSAGTEERQSHREAPICRRR